MGKELRKLHFKGRILDNQNFQQQENGSLDRKIKPPESVKFNWYKKLLTKKEYEGNESCPILREEGVGVGKKYQVAFMSVTPRIDCLKITDSQELIRIDQHLRSKNTRPFIFEDRV